MTRFFFKLSVVGIRSAGDLQHSAPAPAGEKNPTMKMDSEICHATSCITYEQAAVVANTATTAPGMITKAGYPAGLSGRHLCDPTNGIAVIPLVLSMESYQSSSLPNFSTSISETCPSTRPSSSGLSVRLVRALNNRRISLTPPHVNHTVEITPMIGVTTR